MILQEQEKGGSEAALGQSIGAAMAVHAGIRKQPLRRFALVDVLGQRGGAEQCTNGSEDQQTAAEFRLSQTLR